MSMILITLLIVLQSVCSGVGHEYFGGLVRARTSGFRWREAGWQRKSRSGLGTRRYFMCSWRIVNWLRRTGLSLCGDGDLVLLPQG